MTSEQPARTTTKPDAYPMRVIDIDVPIQKLVVFWIRALVALGIAAILVVVPFYLFGLLVFLIVR